MAETLKMSDEGINLEGVPVLHVSETSLALDAAAAFAARFGTDADAACTDLEQLDFTDDGMLPYAGCTGYVKTVFHGHSYIFPEDD